MDRSCTASRPNQLPTQIPEGSVPGIGPASASPVTPPSSSCNDPSSHLGYPSSTCDDDYGPPIPTTISHPFTPPPSTRESHGPFSPPFPLTIALVTPPSPVPSMVIDNGLSFPLIPGRPTFTIEKRTAETNTQPNRHCYWIKIIDIEEVEASDFLTRSDAKRATRLIRGVYVGQIVYLESRKPLQGRQIDYMTGFALMSWHETGYKFGLEIGDLPIDIRYIQPKDLYEPPFKLSQIPRYGSTAASIKLISLAEIVAVRYVNENVDVVTPRSGNVDVLPKNMIHKKMTPETNPDDMIVEVDRYLALNGCNYAPKLIGVTGDPATGECRGLLVELIEGVPLSEITVMYHNMRLEVTMNLLKALVAFEDRDEYLQDLKPENIILTPDNGLYVIDFGVGVTDGFFPEEELGDLLRNNVSIKAAIYGFAMTSRAIWNEGVVPNYGSPPPPSRLRGRLPVRLLSLLDDPHAANYPSFRALQGAIQNELRNAVQEECALAQNQD